MSVKAKKHLGQHFLKDEAIAKKISDILSLDGYTHVLEIGPGMGVLTKYLLAKNCHTHVIEIDGESVSYLQKHYPDLKSRILPEDFLKWNPKSYFHQQQFAIIGNFPYNISSQIVFRTLELRAQIPEFGGMFQKEVAQRICAAPGSKIYGILSVLTQAFYHAEYLFTVAPSVFAPPPKVESGVLILKRKVEQQLECDEKLLVRIVKLSFQQRRKTLRNSLKTLNLSDNLKANTIFGQRPEQLSVEAFIQLTKDIQDEL